MKTITATEPELMSLGPVNKEPQPLAKQTQFDIESVFRYAIEHQGTAETIERLMSVRRELNAEKSKAAFDAAMAEFQSESPVIMKNKAVTDAGGGKLYNYAPLEQIIAQVKPLLRKYGFSYTLDTDLESKGGWVIAKCRVVHSEGHSETSVAKFPLGAGTRAMSTTQIYAAALTFASRRVFCNAFGLIPAGEDIDGQTGKPKPPGPSSLAADPNVKELANELWLVLAPVRGTQKNWNEANNWLWREEILDAAANEAAPKLTAKKFREVIDKAKQKLKP